MSKDAPKPQEIDLTRSPLVPEGFLDKAIKETGGLDFEKHTQESLAKLFRHVFENEIMKLRDAGQKEYAGVNRSPFSNFNRTGEEVDIDPKKVMWIFAMKHKDGIASFLRGHTSQREDVRGRINDFIVYLFLLRGKIDEELGPLEGAGLGDLA